MVLTLKKFPVDAETSVTPAVETGYVQNLSFIKNIGNLPIFSEILISFDHFLRPFSMTDVDRYIAIAYSIGYSNISYQSISVALR